MIRRTSVALLLCVALAVSSIVAAQDEKAQDSGKPSDQQSERPRARARLVKPWTELSTLSAEQKEQIIRIHAEAVEAIRKVREKEEADIMALLTPENKTELEALRVRQRADSRSRRPAAAAPDADNSSKDDAEEKDR